jgi:arylsulfatase A-like enzyme
MSFPDPHHPWDPPAAELRRVDWHDLDLPPGHPGSNDAIRAVLAEKPAHWLAWWEGRWQNWEGGPARFCPGALTHDQLREISAKVHVMNELIDEALGRVLRRIAERGFEADTDVIFTTDHGELQGDFGLLYKGPFHTEALMRLPLVWRPAPSADVPAADITDPVGQVDLAPTFCAIAGIPRAPWMQGCALPVAAGSGRERVLCEWDSQFPSHGMHLRSIYRDGWLCTVYEPSTDGQPTGLEAVMGEGVLTPCGIHYHGCEGELYNVDDDPYQFHNRWDDRAVRTWREELAEDLYDSLPAARDTPLLVDAPA